MEGWKKGTQASVHHLTSMQKCGIISSNVIIFNSHKNIDIVSRILLQSQLSQFEYTDFKPDTQY